MTGIDCDGGGSKVDFGLEVVFVSRNDIDVGFQGGTSVGCIVVASSLFGGVRITGFGINSSIGNDPIHSCRHQTTFASCISSIS